jgi:hypothetical protein
MAGLKLPIFLEEPSDGEQMLHGEEQARLALQEIVLSWEESAASLPYNQFKTQMREEEMQIHKLSLYGIRPVPEGSNVRWLAHEIVRKRWVEQGIWDDTWIRYGANSWKHERQLKSESPPHPKPKNDEERQQNAAWLALRKREHEASRPYHQFIYQMSKEREKIQERCESERPAIRELKLNDDRINTKAYENVKNTWKKRKIWNKNWGLMPGMLWKHEDYVTSVQAAIYGGEI